MTVGRGRRPVGGPLDRSVAGIRRGRWLAVGNVIKRFWTADLLAEESCFLWGPRQTGKSTLLRELFPKASTYDLLSAREFRRLSADPGVFSQECLALTDKQQPVIIDEIQKLPALLDEVH
jgi:predicted AAA+ superfamily ATPase